MIACLEKVNASAVLDLGCGNGWFSAALQRCGFEVVGVDEHEPALAMAADRYPDVRFEHAELMSPLARSLLGRFDAVIAVDLLDSVPSPAQFLQKGISALRPGGALILTVPAHSRASRLVSALGRSTDWRARSEMERGPIRSYSRIEISDLMRKYNWLDLDIRTVGRCSLIARSIVVCATLPT